MRPYIAGVGQAIRRPGDEPVPAPDLMEEAARAAAHDAGRPDLLARLDAVAVVDSLSWPGGDPAEALAQRLGSSPQLTVRTGLGGNSPQLAVNDLAARICEGELDVALVVGAEALFSGTQAEGASGEAQLVLAEDRPGSSDLENAAGLIAPIFFYPLIEHALRRDAGRTRDEQVALCGQLWAAMSEVAAENPYAWTPQRYDAQQIASASDDNRLVSSPYTKLMNANIKVDQGAALLLCSEEVDVAADRRVYVHSGADAYDTWFVTERADLHRSPAINAIGRAALDAAGIGIDDVAHLDLYSCFPSAVQVSARELGVELDGRPLTVTGGLTFAGGPGNDYVTHSIAAMAQRLREDPGAYGLVTANGWYVTKHAVGVYSTQPPADDFGGASLGTVSGDTVEVVAGYTGEAEVESYTALYERDGSAGMGVVVARTPDGRRAAARSHDAGTLAWLLDGDDPLGARVRLDDGPVFAPA
jgi:acetyl-CoA C-acetyltransferase